MSYLKIILFCAILVSSAQSAVKIQTKIEMSNGVSLSPVVIAQDKQWATVVQDTIKLKVRPTLLPENAVKLDISLFRIENNAEVLLTSPAVMTKVMLPAEVELSDDDGNVTVRLTVTPSIVIPKSSS